VTDAGLAGRAFRASRSNLILLPAIGACSFLAGIAVARTLPVSEFAVYALALALRGTVQFLSDLGTGAASARVFAQLEAAGRRASALWLYVRLGAARVVAASLLATAAFLAADAALDYLGLPESARAALGCLVVMGAAEILSGLGTYVLTGTLRQRWLNFVLLGYNVVQPALVIAAALTGLGLTGVLAALAVASVGKAAALHVGATRVIRGMGVDGESSEGLARSFTLTAAAASVGKVAAWLHSRPALSFLMLPAAGRADFANFALGYDLSHQVMAFAASPAGNVLPAIAAKVTGNSARLRRALRPVIVSLLIGSGGVAVVVSVALPHVDGVIYGSQYEHIGGYVAMLMPALVLEVALATPATAVLLADDRLLGRFAVIRLVELAAAGLYVLVGLDHLLAATAVMSGVRAATAIVLLVAAERALGSLLPDGWLARFCVTVGSAAAIGAASGALPAANAVKGALAALLAAGTYIVLLRRLRLLRYTEVAVAAQVLPAARKFFGWLAPADTSDAHPGSSPGERVTRREAADRSSRSSSA
jgi:hypothetical protein